MMPSCDQTGLSHFHSSTTSGAASLMSLRILLSVFPRQSPSSAIRFEMSSDADLPSPSPEFFMKRILESSEIVVAQNDPTTAMPPGYGAIEACTPRSTKSRAPVG